MITQDAVLYRTLAEPKSPDDVTASQEAFLREIEDLRIEYAIPELIVVCTSYQTRNEEGHNSQTRILGMGDSRVTPTLAAIAYKQYVKPQIEAAKRLERFANNEYEPNGDE